MNQTTENEYEIYDDLPLHQHIDWSQLDDDEMYMEIYNQMFGES